MSGFGRLVAKVDVNMILYFEVGAFGYGDRFFLLKWNRYGARLLRDWHTFTGEETLECLRLLDEKVERIPYWYACHLKRMQFRGCFWGQRMLSLHDRWHPALVAPIYERRLREQILVLNGDMLQGHQAFGFSALGGHCIDHKILDPKTLPDPQMTFAEAERLRKVLLERWGPYQDEPVEE
jgi:hypothetical protein